MTCFSPSALSSSRTTSTAFAEAVAEPQSCDHGPATVAVASSPVLLRGARLQEEAATPGQPVALSRVIWMFPPVIRSRESPAAAGSAAIIRPSQKPSRFAGLTFCQIAVQGNTKNGRDCAEAVDVETSLWKP